MLLTSRERWPLLAVMVLVAAALAMAMASLSAHAVIAEPVVEVFVEPHPGQLLVRLHLPVAAVGDANLPRLADGTLDSTAIDERLRVVSADLAHNLDLRQADVALPEPIAAARVGADRLSIDVELRYTTGADAAGLSARLNAFRANGGPVRTDLRYRLPSGHDHTISVTGAPARIAFDPGVGEIVQQFVARGVRALLDGGDHLWFLVCVLLVVRSATSAAALFVAAALGQVVAIAISLLQPAISAEWLTALAMIAASAVVIAALQNVVRAQQRWVVRLAVAFGVLSGFSFGQTFVQSSQFAWSHTAIAGVAFAAVAVLGELWLGALTWATRAWLDERGVPERLVTVLGSVIIAHSAVHRLVDRGNVLARNGSFGAERALVWITLGWACVMLLVAIAGAISARARASSDQGRAAAARPTS